VALRPQGGLRAVDDAQRPGHDIEGAAQLLRGELEALGDLLVGASLAQQAEHALLEAGEAAVAAHEGSAGDERPRGARGERRLAPRGSSHGVGQQGGIVVVEEVAACAGVDGVEDPGAVERRREHHDVRRRRAVADRRDQRGIVADDGDVGKLLGGEGGDRAAAAGRARENEVVAAGERAGGAACDEDPNGAHGLRHGSMTARRGGDRQGGRTNGREGRWTNGLDG
jgi:hypothetical protein